MFRPQFLINKAHLFSNKNSLIEGGQSCLLGPTAVSESGEEIKSYMKMSKRSVKEILLKRESVRAKYMTCHHSNSKSQPSNNPMNS